MAQNTIEWCDSCNRLVADDAVVVDKKGVHRCPLCRHELRQPTEVEGANGPISEEHPRPPWHFKLLLVATVIYLIYRTIWYIQRLSHHG
jgi:hypothetical protein